VTKRRSSTQRIHAAMLGIEQDRECGDDAIASACPLKGVFAQAHARLCQIAA
jgi:hypothetical protein